MPINFENKINQRPIGAEQLIINEVHIVGITGVATTTPNYIRLLEVPLQESPSSIAIPGYVEVTTAPGTTEFKVDYTNGRILFNASENGNTIFVTYYGRGSIVDAEDVNELQQVFVGSVTPGSPTIGIANLNGTLSDGIVRPNNISTITTDDFLFSRDVTINGDLDVKGTVTYIESTTVQIKDNIIQFDYGTTGAPTLNSGIEVVRGTSPNVQLIWNETDDAWAMNNTSGSPILEAFNTGIVSIPGSLTLSGPLTLGNGTVSAPAYSFSSETGTGLYRSGVSSLSTAISGVERLTLTSTYLDTHLLPVQNFVVELRSSDPVSPTTGQIYFDTTTNQYKGYNGSSVVLLG